MRALPLLVLAIWVGLAAVVTHGFRDFTNYSAALSDAGSLPRPAPEAAFVDQTGAHRHLDSLRGHWVLLNFMYLNCPGGCPLVASNLGRVERILTADNRRDIQLLSLDFEPDSPEAVRHMWMAHGSPAGWSMGVLEKEPAQVLRRFGVYAARRKDGVINHALYLFLVDPSGVIRRVFAPDESAEAVAAQILREAPPPEVAAR